MTIDRFANPALLVVDMQNDFVRVGAPLEVPESRVWGIERGPPARDRKCRGTRARNALGAASYAAAFEAGRKLTLNEALSEVIPLAGATASSAIAQS